MKTQERKQQHSVNARERGVNALKLRKLGWNYDDIAKECGYSGRGSAWMAVHRLLSRYEAESVDELRQVEGERLNDLMRVFMLRAMKGETDAASIVLRVIGQRARLFGVNRQSDTTINIFASPEWQEVMHMVFESLKSYPEAHQAVIAQIEDERAKRRGA